MDKIKAVIFDIDGTVAPGVSWYEMTKDLGCSVDEHAKIFRAFGEDRITFDAAKGRLIALWRGSGRANRAELTAMFERWPVFPAAQELISFLNNRGIKLAFITGAMDLYAKTVARKFSVPDHYSNSEFVFDDDENLADMTYHRDQSKKKLEHFLEFCEARSLAPHEVAAVGDSDNDVGVFAATKHGIMVGSEKPKVLKNVAWKETDDIAGVKKLLEPLL